MIANVTEYTKEEGGQWLEWPFKTFKPTNPQLNAKDSVIELQDGFCALFSDPAFAIFIYVHSLRLDDGREWDCINGFREK